MSGAGLEPLARRDRIDLLDLLRGLALLGIALMNVEWFTAPLVARVDGIDPAAAGLDRWLDGALYVLASGKFWVLFALLFGMGSAVMQERARVAGRAFAPVYLRRTFGLLAIGLLHACLLWSGDILVTYALAALLLLALLGRAPTTALWAWGAGLYYAIVGLLASSALLLGVAGSLGVAADAADATGTAARLAFQREEIAAYASGSYLDATHFRVRFLLGGLDEVVFFLPMALGAFLAGAWLVRSGAMASPAGHRPLFRGLAWIAAPAGLALTLLGVAIDPAPDLARGMAARPLWAATLHLAGAPLLALGYMAWIVLARLRDPGRLAWLAPAGRMALTLYLVQSLVGTLVFYGYGLGLWGRVGRVAQVAGVAVLFAAQVAFAHAWMARFRFGPVEWVWRALTYLRLPPMRRRHPLPPSNP